MTRISRYLAIMMLLVGIVAVVIGSVFIVVSFRRFAEGISVCFKRSTPRRCGRSRWRVCIHRGHIACDAADDGVILQRRYHPPSSLGVGRALTVCLAIALSFRRLAQRGGNIPHAY